MKQGSNNRRSRSRSGGGGGKRQSGGGRNSFESNGPDVKIRGTAQQVQEKYLSLARDASSSGDWISAEAYFQFAEHYYRVANASSNNGTAKTPQQDQGQGQDQNRGGRNPRPQASQDTSATDTQGNAPETQTETQTETTGKAPAKTRAVRDKVAKDAVVEGEAEVIDTSPAALAAAVA
ncbi:MAG: DUF4167 domain-containing protein, partial [Rhodospirillales bacterium]|nr:DUF4167 domain-containing protein [Rhodospirillales bacterium]